MTLDYWNNYNDSFGSHMPKYEQQGYCVFRFGGADTIVNNKDIGLSEHLHVS